MRKKIESERERRGEKRRVHGRKREGGGVFARFSSGCPLFSGRWDNNSLELLSRRWLEREGV